MEAWLSGQKVNVFTFCGIYSKKSRGCRFSSDGDENRNKAVYCFKPSNVCLLLRTNYYKLITIPEAWLSGLKQHPAKMLCGKPHRRFESFRLRKTKPFCGFCFREASNALARVARRIRTPEHVSRSSGGREAVPRPKCFDENILSRGRILPRFKKNSTQKSIRQTLYYKRVLRIRRSKLILRFCIICLCTHRVAQSKHICYT